MENEFSIGLFCDRRHYGPGKSHKCLKNLFS